MPKFAIGGRITGPINIEPSPCSYIERALANRIEQVGDTLGGGLGISSLGTTVRAELQPIIHSTASALVAAVAAGDTPEQFAERLALANAEES